MLRIHCYTDENIDDFIKEMKRVYPFEITVSPIPEEPQWERKGDALYINKDFLRKEEQGDMTGWFISDWRNWERKLKGFYRGGTYSFASRHRYAKDTGEHEVLHLIRALIYDRLGIHLKDVFGVEDYDRDIVHNPEYWKKGYMYDEVWKILTPYLDKASQSRTALLRRLLAWFRSDQHIAELKHFKKSEFNHYDKMNPQTLSDLDQVREEYGLPLVVTSDWRETGSHSQGTELDLRVPGGVVYKTFHAVYQKGDGRLMWDMFQKLRKNPSKEVKDNHQFQLADLAIKHGFTRIGFYSGHIHLGQGSPQFSMWTGVSK